MLNLRATTVFLALMIFVPMASAEDATTARSAETVAPVDPVADTPVSEKPTLTEQLGRPAKEATVRDLLKTLDRRDIESALRLVGALGYAGGIAAARGLAVMILHPNANVRRVALATVRRIGLRDVELLARVREARTDGVDAVAIEACRALGTVGDGADVARLLEIASSGNSARVRNAAFGALRELTGVRLPNVHARWTRWWSRRRERGVAAVTRSLEALVALSEKEEDDRFDADAVIQTLVRDAWTDLDRVRVELKEWLYTKRTFLQRVACRLAATWGLAELADPIERIATSRWSKAKERDAAERALKTLGVPQ